MWRRNAKCCMITQGDRPRNIRDFSCWCRWFVVYSLLEIMCSRECSSVFNYYPPALPRDAMRKCGLCCRPVSVRLSLCPSVCLSRSCIVSRRLKISSNFFLGLVAPSLVFLTQSADTQFQGESLHRGRELNTRGGKRFAIFWLLLRHCCYETLIGSRKRRIGQCRFRWPWVTLKGGVRGHFFNWISLN